MNPQDRMCNGVARRKSAANVVDGEDEEGDGIGDGDEVEDEVRAREGDGVEEGKEEWEMKLEFLLKFGLNCQNCWRCLSSDLRCGWFSVSSSEMNWFTCNIAHMRAESSPRTLAGAEANKKGHFTKRIANEAGWLAERERESSCSVPGLSLVCPSSAFYSGCAVLRLAATISHCQGAETTTTASATGNNRQAGRQPGRGFACGQRGVPR